MKKLLAVLLAALMLFTLAACGGDKATDGNLSDGNITDGSVEPSENKVIRISTTTSVNDSGLLPYLLPAFEEATGYRCEVQSAGTGAAIQKAKDGNADLILVHAKASEEEFVAEGYGVERIPFMYNYFVVVGPAADEAGIADCENAGEAFAKIKEAEATFISRGDDSGTHKAELKIWAEQPDAATDEWYISSGQKMGQCLTMADEMGGYCLTDKATYLANKASFGDLELLLEKGEDMKNTYSLIECNPEKLADINTEGAKAFIEWMTGDEASVLIAEYGKEQYGAALFYLLEE